MNWLEAILYTFYGFTLVFVFGIAIYVTSLIIYEHPIVILILLGFFALALIIKKYGDRFVK